MLNRVESGQRELDSTAQEVFSKVCRLGRIKVDSREGQEVARNF